MTLEFDLIPFPHKSEQIVMKVKNIVQEFGLQGKIMSITLSHTYLDIKKLQRKQEKRVEEKNVQDLIEIHLKQLFVCMLFNEDVSLIKSVFLAVALLVTS